MGVQYGWQIKNGSATSWKLVSYSASMYGAFYDSGGTAQIRLVLDGQEVYKFRDTNYFTENVHAIYGTVDISLAPGAVLDVEFQTLETPFDPVPTGLDPDIPVGLAIRNTLAPGQPAGSTVYDKSFIFTVTDPQTSGGGGGGGSGGGGGGSSGGGGGGTVEPPGSTGRATVTLWAYPPDFGLKTLIPPPRPAALDYPTTAGPNAQATLDGALLTPAQVPDAEGGLLDVANVEFTLSAGAIETQATIGILPFQESGV